MKFRVTAGTNIAGAADNHNNNVDHILNDISFVSLNCNSLNLACNSETYELKVQAINSLNYDVIFLSDLRMGEISNQNATH
jgi:hypothetical protein